MATAEHEHETIRVGNLKTTLQEFLKRLGNVGDLANCTWWGRSIQTVNNAKVVSGNMTDVGSITMTGSINMPRLGDGIKFLVDSSYIPVLRMFQNSDIVALGYETFQRGFGTNIYGNDVYIQHGIYDGTNYFTSFRSNGHVTINAQDDTDASRNIFLNVGGSTKTNRLYLSNDIYLVVENGGVHVVGGGLYADTFVSAYGKGDDGGGSGTIDLNAVWNALTTYDNIHKINNNYLDLKGLSFRVGTEANVTTYNPTGENAKTIVFDSAANGGISVTRNGDNILFGLSSIVPINAPNKNDTTYTKVVVDSYGRVVRAISPDTLAGYGITDAKIAANGVITLGNDTITPLTDAKIKSDYEWWGQKLDASGKVDGDITVTKTGNNIAVKLVGGSYNFGLHLGSGGTNRGIYEFSPANKWLLYFDASNTILNYGNVGIGTTPSQSYKLHVDGTVKATKYYLTDDIYFEKVTENGVDFVKLNGNFYATGAVSALGANASGGGASTFNESQMWQALANSGTSHKIHNDHLSLGTLTINGEAWNPATSGNKTITITSADGYITPIASGNVNTAKGDGNVWFKKAYVSSEDGTPNNGVVIEYGNSTSWVGQLYLGDNANQGLYWNGWYDGVRGTWKKIAFADDYLPLTGGTLSKSGRDILYINQEGSDAVGSYITFKVNGTDAGYFGYNTGSGFFIQHVYNGVNKTLKIGTDGSLSFAGNTVLDSGNSSVSKSGETLTVKINGTTQSLTNTNTWRGIQDSLTSDSATDSLSAKQGKVLKGLIDGNTTNIGTLQGYFTNGVANSAAKLNTGSNTYTAWGKTYWSNGVPKTISGDMTGVGSITMSGAISGATTISASSNVTVGGTLGVTGATTLSSTLGVTGNTSLSGTLSVAKATTLSSTLSVTGLLSANGNIQTGSSNGSYVKIGGLYLVYDSNNNAIKVSASATGNDAANFYATGAVSAIGANASGGSGSGIDANWLKTNDVQIQRLGIGVAPSSSYALTVSGSVTVSGSISSSNSSISCAHDITAGGRGLIQERLTVGDTSVNTSYNLYVKGSSLFNGNVGIGGYDNACKLYVSGKVKFSKMSISNTTNPDSTTYTSLGVSDSLNVSVTGSANINKAWVVSSDMRLKDVCQHFDIDITSVAKAPLFTYRLKNSGSQLMVGTSAQYWMDKIPETVTLGYDGYYGLDYNGVLTASVISVARKVVDHELRIKQLEQENAILREEIKSLKAA